MTEPRRGPNPFLWITIVGNLLGAIVAFLYFRVVDYAATTGPKLTTMEVAYSLVIFAVLVGVGTWLSRRWALPLGRVAELDRLPAPEARLARQRALFFPYFLAGITFTAWVLAGLIWGVLLRLPLTVHDALRQIFGTTVIAGGVTTAFIFFAGERVWRRRLPEFFPAGDLSSVTGVPRLAVRVRLIAISLLIGVVPLAVLGMLAYTRALDLLGADPATAGLSIFVANSVAGPLKDVETAMAEVERGRLDGHCAVVSTDEIGAVAEGFNRMLHGLRDREMVKETFGRYVTPEVRDEILAGRISGEGELKDATILFADLRDFTPWVEATEPHQVVRELNEYFTEMAEAIRDHQGLVLQFIGDEI